MNISGNDVQGTIAHVRDTVRKFDPQHPFVFEFLDEALDRLYVADQRLTRLIAIFAGFCIFIACLGLFGLAAFTAAQRTREIGVRKVFGARTGQIITLLAQKIVLLVLGAAAVASVLAYLVMRAWLENFAFRTGINPLIFVAAALAGLGDRVRHGRAAVDEGRSGAPGELATVRVNAAGSSTSSRAAVLRSRHDFAAAEPVARARTAAPVSY